jgi:hypothetical protein
MARRRRVKPADPQAIILRRAQERAAAREAVKHPDRWGVSEDNLTLPTAQSLEARRDGRGRVFHAYRSDVFDLLKGRGGLSDAQHEAARRLERDVAARAGLSGAEGLLTVIDSSGSREAVTQRMVDAGRRVDKVLARCGPSSCTLLRGLVEPMVLEGAIIMWRVVVERITGEGRAEVQAALVRRACVDLDEAYRAMDAMPARAVAR